MTLVHAARMAGQMVLPEGEEEIFHVPLLGKTNRQGAETQRRKDAKNR